VHRDGVTLVAAGPTIVERPEVDETTDESTLLDRPWIVLVWNDPINLMSYVTFVFQKLFGYSLEKATQLMLDVHEKGRAVVSSGNREKAEMDVYRLHEHGLWATMQKDGSDEPT
jgi:ATP-dependent Clp protease adaptor protein ClpS